MPKELVVGGAIAFGLLLVGGAVLVATAMAKRQEPPAASTAIAPAPSPAPAPPPREPTLDDQTTLSAALAFVLPFAGQPPTGEHSRASAMLAAWAVDRLRWSDVAVDVDETNFGLAQKNLDKERGKRLCVSGSVVQITENNVAPGKTMNEGLVLSGAGNLFYFLGVKSSGSILKDSWARFCGVVVDRYDYENSAGGTGHAIEIVGMFDLPENRAAPLPVVRPNEATPRPRTLSVEDLPRSVPAAASNPAGSAPNCSPPYTTDEAGHRVFKRECM